MALPDRFEDFNGDAHSSVSEAMSVWARHIALELNQAKEKVYGDNPPPSAEAWQNLSQPIVASCIGLETLFPASYEK